MKTKGIGIAGCGLLLAVLPASAETTTGWLTYLAEDGHQLMLNSQDMYDVGCDCLKSVAIGDQVRIVWQRRGKQKTVTAISKVPFDPTAS